MKNGVRVKAVEVPYLWNTYSEKKDYGDGNNFSLHLEGKKAGLLL